MVAGLAAAAAVYQQNADNLIKLWWSGQVSWASQPQVEAPYQT